MDDISSVVVVVAVMAFLTLLLKTARAGKPREGFEPETLVFRHGNFLLGLALLTTIGVPIAVTALLLFRPPKEDEVPAAILLYVLFVGVGAPLLWEATRFALVLSPAGLDCRSPWKRGCLVAWDDVEELSYSQANMWFILRAAGGWKFHVPVFVPGMNEFLAYCEQYLPPALLVDAAAGYARVGRAFPGDWE